MDLHLKDKVVLVSGGSRGIGKAICMAFAEEGAKVAVGYARNSDLADAVAADIKAKCGTDAIAVGGDFSKEDDVVAVFDNVESELGPMDVVVNNAAYCPTGTITSFTREEWDYTFAVNVTGVFVACREFVKRQLDRGDQGTIVNIGSQAAFQGSKSGHLPYDSSKGALSSFTIALARELAPKGINVNCVAPGMVLTEMVAEKWEAKKDEYLTRIPMQRIADPMEIARVTVFLASDAASYMTGTTVNVSGGMLMR